ncbi:MAG: hypothetical protein ACE366_21950 [Bradymonadia bacterium]
MSVLRHTSTFLRGLTLSLASMGALCPQMAMADAPLKMAKKADPTFSEIIQRVVAMPGNADLQRRARALGLNVLNVMWEDTGRAAGSALGPNISDLTLQVREPTDGDKVRTHLLPVIRHPNFTDKTADIPADELWVKVGNEVEGEGDIDATQLKAVPLTHVLENLKDYLSDPESLKGEGNFLADRDSHFLVSAQHVFVPLPSEGKAEFNPVLFNYQSAPESPAVLTLLITRQGTSATIIENKSGDQSFQGWGQQLFFNHGGQKTVFTAERKSAVAQRIEQTIAQGGEIDAQDAGALDEGADMMMIVQVPLKHKGRGFLNGLAFGEDMDLLMEAEGGMAVPSAAPLKRSLRGGASVSDVEQAVLGHGEDMGPFEEMGGLKLERDEAFPIRVTVQFYKATSNGVVSEADLKAAHADIQKVYDKADYVGSLVVPKGERVRPTDWIKDDPNGGDWSAFPWFGWFSDDR